MGLVSEVGGVNPIGQLGHPGHQLGGDLAVAGEGQRHPEQEAGEVEDPAVEDCHHNRTVINSVRRVGLGVPDRAWPTRDHTRAL